MVGTAARGYRFEFEKRMERVPKARLGTPILLCLDNPAGKALQLTPSLVHSLDAWPPIGRMANPAGKALQLTPDSAGLAH